MPRSSLIVQSGGKGRYFSSEDWPQQIEPYSVAALTELVKSPQPRTHALVAVTGNTLNLSKIIDCQKYSSLNCLLRVTARVLRFVEVT